MFGKIIQEKVTKSIASQFLNPVECNLFVIKLLCNCLNVLYL